MVTSPLDTSIALDVTGPGSHPEVGEGLCPILLAIRKVDADKSLTLDLEDESGHATNVACITCCESKGEALSTGPLGSLRMSVIHTAEGGSSKVPIATKKTTHVDL